MNVKTDRTFAALIITDLVRVEVGQGFVGGLVPVLVVKHVVSLQKFKYKYKVAIKCSNL